MSNTQTTVPETNTTLAPKGPPFHVRHAARVKHHWSLWLNGPHVAACIVAVVLLVAGVMTFKGSWAQVRVAGVTVSANSSETELAKTIAQKASAYKITIQRTDGARDTYSLNDAGMTVDTSKSAATAVRAKHSGAWWERLQWWNEYEIPVAVQSNNARLDGFVREQVDQTKTPYLNAIIAIEDGKPVIHESQVGEALAVEGGRRTVYDRVAGLDTQPLVQRKVRIEPKLTEADLKDDQTNIADILDNSFDFTIGNNTVTAEPADIGAWLQLTPDEKKKQIAISINQSAVDSYVDSLALPYATASRASVVVDMPDGTSSLLFQGQGGGGVANKAAVARELAQSVKTSSDADFNLQLDYDTTPVIHASAADRWLLVDITTKRMYAMENNQIARTFLVSAGASATPTVTGKFNIYAKFASQDMRGANADGSNYFQPNVQWINYFYRDYAVHGNYWRPNSYFGNINSSHGCVGITNEQAEWIYNWTSIGTPVVVYS